MNWLRSWTLTPEQRVSNLVQELLEKGELSQSDWCNLYSDIMNPEIPPSLIRGFPGLLEAMQERNPDMLITICNLLTAMAKASILTQHGTALLEENVIPSILSQFKKNAAPEIEVEALAILRNLLLIPAGAEAFMSADGLNVIFRLLNSVTRIEARVHLLSMLANLVSRNDYAAFQVTTKHIDEIKQRFRGNTNKMAIAVVHNLMIWDSCFQVMQVNEGAKLTEALVQALGEKVTQDCESSSLEYCLASRIISRLAPDAGNMEPLKPAIFPYKYEPIFVAGVLED